MFEQGVAALLKGVSAESPLLISTDSDLLSSLARASALPSMCIHSVDEWNAGVKEADRFGCVLLIGLLEHLPKQDGLQILAALRDVHAREILVVLPIDTGDTLSQWQETDLLAMGMKQQGQFEEDGLCHAIYSFSLKTYKPTPDWLNSRFWANPELFGKFRW